MARESVHPESSHHARRYLDLRRPRHARPVRQAGRRTSEGRARARVHPSSLLMMEDAMTISTTQRVLVTAGASGIGHAITEAFVSAGAKVFVCDIDEAALQRLQEQMPGVVTSVCDIGDRAAAARMVDDAAAALGGIDVLVNNAGIAGPAASVADMDPDAWESVLRVNLTGTFIVTQHAIPHLKQSGAGTIVIMSSL